MTDTGKVSELVARLRATAPYIIQCPLLIEAADTIEAMRDSQKALHRRCQEAEKSIPDYQRIVAMPPNGDGVRFVSGNLWRALLASLAHRQQDDLDALAARLRECEKDAGRYRWLRDAVLTVLEPMLETYGGTGFDKAVDAAIAARGDGG